MGQLMGGPEWHQICSIYRIRNRIQVLMQALWVMYIAGRGVESIEASCRRVIISRPQILLLDPGIKLLSTVQQRRGGS